MGDYYLLAEIVLLKVFLQRLVAATCVVHLYLLQEYVDLNAADNYLLAAGASALVSSKAGRAAKVSTAVLGLE